MNNILISSKIKKNQFGQLTYEIEEGWWNFFRNKKINLLTSNLYSNFNRKFKSLNISAIILPGGNNLTQFSKKKVDLLREKIDRKILIYGIKKKIPILGVCYGFQLIADYYGVRLKKVKNHIKKKHLLDFKTDKLSIKIQVNSFHNYVVNNLPDYFNEVVKCQDGSIEYAFSQQKKIMCMMFHPERKNNDKLFLKKLVFKFLNI